MSDIKAAAAQLRRELEADEPDGLVHCGHAWQALGDRLKDGTEDVILVVFNRATDYNPKTYQGHRVVVQEAGAP